jgi:hypothetical protein
MSRPEIQQAIMALSEKEQWKLVEWFREFMANQWDREIERDVAAGKFDKFFAKADEDRNAGRFTSL